MEKKRAVQCVSVSYFLEATAFISFNCCFELLSPNLNMTLLLPLEVSAYVLFWKLGICSSHPHTRASHTPYPSVVISVRSVFCDDFVNAVCHDPGGTPGLLSQHSLAFSCLVLYVLTYSPVSPLNSRPIRCCVLLVKAFPSAL